MLKDQSELLTCPACQGEGCDLCNGDGVLWPEEVEEYCLQVRAEIRLEEKREQGS